MFELTFTDGELRQKIQDPTKYYPSEVSQELGPLLDRLKQDGKLAQSDYYHASIQRCSAQTFYLFYQLDSLAEAGRGESAQSVIVLALRVKPADILKQRFAIADHSDALAGELSIPQYDNPRKIIHALELIAQGISESYQLGYELGHRGKKREYIMRHGNYAKHTLEQLQLITKIRQDKVWLAQLTETGKRIIDAPIRSLKFRALIEAMLNYPLVWQLIVAITEMEARLDVDTVLSDELIKQLVVSDGVITTDTRNTSNRRAQTLKNWIKWIANYSGIPLQVHDDGTSISEFPLGSELDADAES